MDTERWAVVEDRITDVASLADPGQERAHGAKDLEVAPDRARGDAVGSELLGELVHGERDLAVAQGPPEPPLAEHLLASRHDPPGDGGGMTTREGEGEPTTLKPVL